MKPAFYYSAVSVTFVIMAGYFLVFSTPAFRTRNIAIPVALFLSAVLAFVWAVVLARKSREESIQVESSHQD